MQLAGRQDERAVGEDQRDQGHHRWEEPPGAAPPEGQEPHGAGAAVLGQEQARDEEAGDDEEDVDTGYLITMTLLGQVVRSGKIRPLAYLGRIARRVWPLAAVVLRRVAPV